MPKVSIIIPVYNVEKYLPACIDSILNQSFKDFEVLLIDDGSTDKSREICDKYSLSDKRIRTIHKINEGVSIARNTGIKEAKAEWITFIDSDDWVEKDFLSAFFQKGKEITPTTLVSQGILFDYDGKKANEPFFQYDTISATKASFPSIIPQYKILHNGCPCCKLFNRELIINNNILFTPKTSTHEDHIFVLNYLLYIDKLILLDSLLYHYMKREITTLSSSKHPAESYIIVSDMIYNLTISLKEKFNIQNDKYISRFIRDYCLYLLTLGMLRTTSYNRISICKKAKLEIKKFPHLKIKIEGKSNKILYSLSIHSTPIHGIAFIVFLLQKFNKIFSTMK